LKKERLFSSRSALTITATPDRPGVLCISFFGGFSISDNSKRDWKTLAQLAANEPDPQKLIEIVAELNAVLLENEQRGKPVLRRVLLVDDDPGIRLTLVPVLRDHGFTVEFVSGVPEALQKIQNFTFDILISDLNIAEPGDGFHVVTAMRKAHPRAVIILLTGYTGLETAIEGIRQNVDDYVVKPVDYDRLIEILETKLTANHR